MIESNIKKEFDCDPEKIWKIVTDNSECAWRSDLSKTEIVDDVHFIEYDKNNYPTHFFITKKEKLKEYRFDIKNSRIKGEFIGIFKKSDNGKTLLDFTEKIEAGNFLMKLLGKAFLKNQQKKYFENLENAIAKEMP